MSDPSPERPKRRPRYAGKNPRKFSEKYKEHAPERYAADVEKVLARGKTPAGTHRPIMLREIMELLAPPPGATAVDATLGYGGHARELLAAIQPGGQLIAMDADPIELPKTEARLRALGFPAESLLVRRMNFAGLAQLLATAAPDGADVILADLGVSSMQIDNPARGFTFKADGPLDLRMNPARGQSAAALLAGLSAAKLEKLLIESADEPHAALLARTLTGAPAPGTTTALAAIIRAAVPREDDAELSVRRVFQALRIAVNDEFAALDTFLRHLPQCLKPGGRVAILTFHSGEDRRVKHAFKTGERNGLYAAVARDVIRPSADELHANPRSSSAKLRWARRAAGPSS
ncbi:MAG: 16S rRNA (cytosine(1402)-N(4))-methyltransferase RsmH [Chthoniobacter sp.]|nr:16S rRNA (cytosine(1402)-N(4))-methyltransferase RsmH [Chthoniobacter sp.]